MSPSAFPFLVKVCGITREEDAECAVVAGANAIGFNFYANSPRYINLSTAQQLAARIPSSVLKTGIFVNPAPEEIQRAIERVPLDVIQLHGVVNGTEWPLPVWRAVPNSALGTVTPGFDAYLIDSPTPGYGGSGQVFNWKLAAGMRGRVILAGGLDNSNVGRAIETARPWGVDACSRLECSPGIKDPARVRAFVSAALASLQPTHEVAL
jgi:phosphoribosylanthranilate isomerase